MSRSPSSTNLSSLSSELSLEEYGIESIAVDTAPDVIVTPQKKLIVGCILDLFKGRPTLKKLKLWADDATFNDPFTLATGRKQYQAQWYGLKNVFSEIEQLQSVIISSGNPIILNMKTRYKIKLVGMDQIISSQVKIYMSISNSKIIRVDDQWCGKIPDEIFDLPRLSQFLSLCWWLRTANTICFYFFSLIWWTRIWKLFRILNGTVVPILVRVPESIGDESKEE
ncbi:hypothetical protein GcM1_221053 [Golovinomyces cichoracearum]|uniref:Uncharacterized protein n=1 Tax=Golovinomyces cichoracearum TaxID=62708 RepID=A0A420IRS3_9PEZI|nr:hypothetical protein GcM1_221053 [Golovinomyces cichoracearum]